MIQRQNSNRRMSQIVTFPLSGTGVMLAGQVADTKTLDFEGQTKEVLPKTDALLKQAEASKERVVSAWIWLKDIKDFDKMNAHWDAWVAPGQAPARACVESNLAFEELLVEIQVMAVK
ncbi:RidA family protein [Mesorhizobium sp. M1076]|uniref:RidA family protein n=1 Tax=Mesorhizobium sp. M1076 TaxID=2957054 RepID=UPI003336BF02